MDDDETEEGGGNVVPFGRPEIVAANDDPDEEVAINPLRIPRDYIITDIDNFEWYGTGFLVFTPENVAIMKMLDGGGAVPAVVLPIVRVKAAELYDEDDV